LSRHDAGDLTAAVAARVEQDLRRALTGRRHAESISIDGVEWDMWIRHARSHFIDTVIALDPPQDAPAGIIDQLYETRRALALRNLHLVAQLGNVTDAMERRGVRAMAYKGPVLAQHAYGALYARDFVDMDILVAPADAAAAAETLEKHGFHATPSLRASAYRRYLSTYRQMPFMRDEDECVIEMHTAFMPAYLPMGAFDEAVFERSRIVSVAGVSLRTPSHEDHLVLLCMHGTKEAWPHLRAVADIAALLVNATELDTAQAAQIARAADVVVPFAIGITLADRLIQQPAPGASDALDITSRERSRAETIADRSSARLKTPNHIPGNREELTVVYPSLDSAAARARFVVHHASGFTLADAQRWPGGDHGLGMIRMTRPIRLSAKYAGRFARGVGRRVARIFAARVPRR
jgi:hypothetical protein